MVLSAITVVPRSPHHCSHLGPPQRAKKERYKGTMGKFGKAQVQDVLSAAFVSAQTLVTGVPSGELLMWDVGGSRSPSGQLGCCIKVSG